MDDELELTVEEAGELKLPQHDNWNGDEIVWGARSQIVRLECSVCHTVVNSILNLPADVAIDKPPRFTCRECNGAIGFSRSGRPHRKRGPKKVPESGQVESRQADETVLWAALAGTSDSLEFLSH